jgi:hypothetical protein
LHAHLHAATSGKASNDEKIVSYDSAFRRKHVRVEDDITEQTSGPEATRIEFGLKLWLVSLAWIFILFSSAKFWLIKNEKFQNFTSRGCRQKFVFIGRSVPEN